MGKSFQVSFLNSTSYDLNDISVRFCETYHKCLKNLPKADNFCCEEIHLRDHKLLPTSKTDTEKSVDLLNEEDHQQWQVRFSYKGYFYETRTTNVLWVNFDLKFKEKDLNLEISINKNMLKKLQATFEIGKKKKIFLLEKIISVSNQIEKIKKLKQDFLKPKLFLKFFKSHQNFINSIEELTNVTDVELKDLQANKLFNLSQEGMENLEKINDEKSASEEIFPNDKVLPVYKNLKQNWLEITNIVKKFKVEVKYFEKRLDQNENDEDNESIKLIFELLDLIDSMQITHILCEFLEIVGFAKTGVTFEPICPKDSVNVIAQYSLLITTLKGELSLWDQTSIEEWSRLDKPCSSSNKKIKFANEFNQNEDQDIRKNTLVRCSELFDIVRRKLTGRLDEISEKIKKTNRNVKISSFSSSAVGAVGGGLIVTGLALEGPSLGTSTALIVVGAAITATGVLASVGSCIVDVTLTIKFLHSTTDLTSFDIHLCNSMMHLKNVINKFEMSRSPNFTDAKESENINLIVSNVRDILNIGTAIYKVAAKIVSVGTFQASFATLGIIVNIFQIIHKSKNVFSKKSKLGKQVKIQPEILDRERVKILEWVNSL